MSHGSTRRHFMQSMTAAAVAGALAPSARRAFAANEKLNHACIGVGGMGWNDLNSIASHPGANIAAICDVDANHLAAAARAFPNARTYADWRELLDKEGDRIDSVNVTVPDHMHAAIGLAVIRRGKHIYCQKPMCHDVAEVRAMTRAVAAKGVVSQLGTQHASGQGDQQAVHFIRQGTIGRIKRVLLCSNRSNIEAYRPAGPRPTHSDPVPSHLNWEHWLGTAPERPFVKTIYHPGLWRGWQDFGTGWLGDIGCHIFDAPWKALGLTAPTSVSAEVQQSWIESRERRGDTWPQSQHVTWEFPANDMTDGPVTVEWFDGEFFPDEELRKVVTEHEPSYPEESAFFVGTEGMMLLRHGGGPLFFPRDKFKSIERPRMDARSHYHRFVDACLGGEPTNSPFAIAGPMTEAILLGTIAIRIPTKLEWQSAPLRFTNSPEANDLLRRTYREGWEVELGA